ncbi:D-allulose 6-phosphate 3-epimerase [Paenibacillus kribbensis]|uniref:D-allulose 6-phosphate 3-epimerase n=1 Tax=Paenibacillus kribbensis TaxID=172713 RepID=UPI0015BA8851|nr:D-allulose 6-phosphate 3-epimerase [Paenibacillus kribbensis]
MKKHLFSPSLMCMNLMDIENQLKVLNQRADMVHIDIMDGHYVKNITLSPYFMEQIRESLTIPMDVHLMVEKPSEFIKMIIDAGATYISPHAEVINSEAFRMIDTIKSAGCKAGIALNPATPLSHIQHYIHHLDKITFMSVDPGFAGQKFIPEVLGKIREAKALKEKHGYNYLIEIDGSCNEKTFKILEEAGVEVFIVGTSGLFNLDSDLNKAWDQMMEHFNSQVNAEV